MQEQRTTNPNEKIAFKTVEELEYIYVYKCLIFEMN